jgi:hypothetical protein
MRTTDTMGAYRDYTPTPAAKPEPNAALREIAGRIKKLSYRDLEALAKALDKVGLRMPGSDDRVGPLSHGVLAAADALESP